MFRKLTSYKQERSARNKREKKSFLVKKEDTPTQPESEQQPVNEQVADTEQNQSSQPTSPAEPSRSTNLPANLPESLPVILPANLPVCTQANLPVSTQADTQSKASSSSQQDSNQKDSAQKDSNQQPASQQDAQSAQQYAELAKQNVEKIKQLVSNSSDLQVKEFKSGEQSIHFLFFETLVDSQIVYNQIMNPLLHHPDLTTAEQLPATTTTLAKDIQEAVSLLLRGFVVLIFSSQEGIICMQTRSVFIRSVTEPVNEKVIRGSHEGFVESMIVNLSLVRNHLPTPDLAVKYKMIGKKAESRTAILYVEDIVNPELVKEVESRLDTIDIDYTPDPPAFIGEFIEDDSFSFFPQILNTERPDRVAANLMDGRVAIVTDGSPSALVMPFPFLAFYQSPDDYNSRWYIGSFYRLIRLLSFFIAFTLPALYISIIAFHFIILPDDLIPPFKASIEKIPYPPIIEALIMELTIELIREAGIRLPTPISQTIGIIGGLVIGSAVVDANLVSNVMVIVVALTAIASFIVPSTEMVNAIRILRFPLMVLASLFGLVGIVFGFIFLLVHLCKLETFGTPYFAPFSTLSWADFKDAFIRMPTWKLNTRPKDPLPQQRVQQSSSRGWEIDDSNQP